MAQRKKNTKTKAEFNYSPRYDDDVKDVHLVGDFNNWEVGRIRMKQLKSGTWKASIALSAGTYEYKFWVDGEWEKDPECSAEVPNPFGTTNSKIDVL